MSTEQRNIPSTRRMINRIKPDFPIGKVVGKTESCSMEPGDQQGGMRLKEEYKKGNEKYPLITYITVVYNRIDTMQRCMESVWKQSYPNVEYIIIDGASNDGTLELIQENEEKIDYYISQKDTGIYNAMNKGIEVASGDYICFMNSDDQCMPDAAELVAGVIRRTGADIICGGRELWNGQERQEEKTGVRPLIKNCVFRYGKMYHQATYAGRKAFEEAGCFDESYKLLSDWIWEAECINKGLKIVFFDGILTRFDGGGASFAGLEVRDTDWIRWIKRTFPEISRKDAECLLFALDEYREPYNNFKVLYKRVSKYLNNYSFKRSLYETVIWQALETQQAIEGLFDGFDFADKKAEWWEEYRGRRLTGCSSSEELENYLSEELYSRMGQESYAIDYGMFERLMRIRSFQNKLHYYMHVVKRFGRKRVLFVRRLRHLKYWTVMRLAAHSSYLATELFRYQRTRMGRGA